MVINRRDWLRRALYAGFGFLPRGVQLLHGREVPAGSVSVQGQVTASAQKTQALASYVDPLPVPPLVPGSKNGEAVEVVMREFLHKAHRDLPPTG
ncbi:MAG TPA: hypothetical protein VK513_12810, partial [Terriglobales bacterium]|nr:hypothetical protein [Terriglobales bacterium]